MEGTGYETRQTSKGRSIVLVWCWNVPSRDPDPAQLFQSNMADGVDFLDGDDLEAILDILEADEEMEVEFRNEVENVSTENTLITYYFREREWKMKQKPEHLNTNV